jgi:protein-S-isoprenylcysteine O-methyltransferase Ste14
VLLACSWLVIFQVFRFNSFASTVVQVESDQKVISTGPYRIVRHPMCSGVLIMAFATPVALASYIAVLPAVMLCGLLVFRTVNEERFLRKELPGYAAYVLRTRYRLAPHIWYLNYAWQSGR